MRLRVAVVPTVLLCAVWATAAAPVKIIGPVEVEANKLVRLTPDGAGPEDLIFWDIAEEQAVDVEEVGQRLFFTGPPGVYHVKVRVIPVRDGKVSGPATTQRATVVIGKPGPGPGPDPPMPPVPVGPAPVAADGLHVMIIYESADAKKLTPGQYQAIFAPPIRTLLNQSCAVAPDGKRREWWILDKDADMASLPKKWQDAMKRPRASVPWLIVSNPQKGGGFEGPLPDDINKTMETIRKYAP